MKKSIVGLILVLISAGAIAGHSWSNFHWPYSGQAVDVTLINSTSPAWDGYVAQAVSDWSGSSVINLVEVNGSSKRRVQRQCAAPAGQIRICNSRYGRNGWLGIASIWIDSSHITQGVTKLNDTYFSTATYNTPAWKQSVTCQELGHNIGLAHQDEDFNNASLYTCMDYQNPPYEYPNAHDFEQLEDLYDHIDAGAIALSAEDRHPRGNASNEDAAQNWGQSMGRRGNHETFIKFYQGGGARLTHVLWIDEE